MEMRICKKCNQSKFVVISFTNRAHKNVCRDCLREKAEKVRRAKGMDPNRHWKKTNFGRVL